MHILERLAEANLIRQHEWDPRNAITLAFRANELAGEVGELCNLLKKIARDRLGLRGSTVTLERVAEEAGDVVICLDLICRDLDISLYAHATAKLFNPDLGTSISYRGAQLAKHVGKLCGYLIEPDARGIPGATGRASAEVYKCVELICNDLGIDLDAAIKEKFNATSAKYGLTTRIE